MREHMEHLKRGLQQSAEQGMVERLRDPGLSPAMTLASFGGDTGKDRAEDAGEPGG